MGSAYRSLFTVNCFFSPSIFNTIQSSWAGYFQHFISPNALKSKGTLLRFNGERRRKAVWRQKASHNFTPRHAIAGSCQTPPSKLPALPMKMRMTRRVSEGGLPKKTAPPHAPPQAPLSAGPAPPPWPPRAVPGATPVTLRLGRPRGSGSGGRPLRERPRGAAAANPPPPPPEERGNYKAQRAPGPAGAEGRLGARNAWRKFGGTDGVGGELKDPSGIS